MIDVFLFSSVPNIIEMNALLIIGSLVIFFLNYILFCTYEGDLLFLFRIIIYLFLNFVKFLISNLNERFLINFPKTFFYKLIKVCF